MPTLIEVPNTGEKRSVATEKELLEFCNSVREAGGATILEELLPSEPNNSRACLIANALNFGCSVKGRPEGRLLYEDGPRELIWAMTLPSNLSEEQKEKIASAVGFPIESYKTWSDPEEIYFVELPREIGNSAWAFDQGIAFQEFRKTFYS